MNKLEILISCSHQSYANLIDTILTPNLDIPKSQWHFFTLWVYFCMISCMIVSFMGASVIGHGLMLLLSISKWHDLLNSQLPVYDGDRQAPPDLLNLLPEGTDPDPDKWPTRHKSIPAFPRRNASASSNRRSFGSKSYFQRNS
jgi:hypothetical protein